MKENFSISTLDFLFFLSSSPCVCGSQASRALFLRKTVCNWKAEKLWNFSFSRDARFSVAFPLSLSSLVRCDCVRLCSQDYEWKRRYVLISAGSCSLLVCCNISRGNYGASECESFPRVHVWVPLSRKVLVSRWPEVELSQRAFDTMYVRT